IVPLVGGCEQLAQGILTRRLASLADKLCDVALIGEGALYAHDLPFGGHTGEEEREPVVAPLLDLGHIGVRYADHAQDDAQRKREREARDDICSALLDEAVDKLRSETTNNRPDRRYTLRSKCPADETTKAVVPRLITIQGSGHLRVARSKQRKRLGRELRSCGEQVLRGEALVVFQDRADVVVAADNPCTETGAEEDGCFVSRTVVDRIRISECCDGKKVVIGSKVMRAAAGNICIQRLSIIRHLWSSFFDQDSYKNINPF